MSVSVGSLDSKGGRNSNSISGRNSMSSRGPASSPSRKSNKNSTGEITKKNRLGMTPPKRIDVSNQAVADELLVSQNLLFLQQDDYYKAQEHIALVSGEVDNLKVVIKKKQDLINRLQQGVTDRDYKIEEMKKEVEAVHIERSAFKVLEEQNISLIAKVTELGGKLEATQKDLRSKIEEQVDIRDYSDKKVADAIKTEVMLQSTIQQITFNLGIAEKSKSLAEGEQEKLNKQMKELSQHLQMVSETSKEQLYRSRVTEYRTLKRLDDMTTKMVAERDDKDLLKETVKMASMRGDVLSNRLGDAIEKTEEQQLMVQSIVRQVENSNDALRGREKVLEKQNMHLVAQLKLSQMAVADMLRRYKIAEGEIETGKANIVELKRKLKPKAKGEVRDADGNVVEPAGNGKVKRSQGMGGMTSGNTNKAYMEKLASLTSESLGQTFPKELHLANSVSASILDTGSQGLGDVGGKRSKTGSCDDGSASAMSDYKNFIQDFDERSQGSGESGGTFATQFGGASVMGASLGQGSVMSGGLSGGKTMFFDGGSSTSRSMKSSSFQPVNGNFGDSASVYADSVADSAPRVKATGAHAFKQDGRGGLTSAQGNKESLPELLAEKESQALGKANLLAAYLRLMISAQNPTPGSAALAGRFPQLGTGTAAVAGAPASSLTTIDLQRCELSDGDMKQIVDLLRLLSIKCINKIDLRYNHFSIKGVEVMSAFIVGIAGADLLRSEPLQIDLRFNHLSAKAIERLGLKIRMTPRPEVKLVQFDDNGEMIMLYGVNKVLVKIDCRNNEEVKVKKSLSERLAIGGNMTDQLEIAYPGDDMDARNPHYYEGTIYPRDSIVNAVSWD